MSNSKIETGPLRRGQISVGYAECEAARCAAAIKQVTIGKNRDALECYLTCALHMGDGESAIFIGDILRHALVKAAFFFSILKQFLFPHDLYVSKLLPSVNMLELS